MQHIKRILLGAVTVAFAVGISAAQFGPLGPVSPLDSAAGNPRVGRGGGGGGGGGRGGRGGGGGGRGAGGGGRGYGGEYSRGNEPIDIPLYRNGIAEWATDPQFKKDTFTFVRLRFTNSLEPAVLPDSYRRGKTSWLNDWPDGDVNISFRLQQMTSMKVNPTPIRLAITDPSLFNYPFALMNQVGELQFTEAEVVALRRWLLNGGFLMVDDHWGNADVNWAQQIGRVLPGRRAEILPLSHPLFHCVFDFKTLPQVPTLQTWEREAANGHPEQTSRPPGYPAPIYRGIYDDAGRMMVLEDANTDTTDGWQREADDEDYFHRFSEKVAYPYMINVVYYMMTR